MGSIIHADLGKEGLEYLALECACSAGMQLKQWMGKYDTGEDE